MYDNTLFQNYLCNILVICPFCMIYFCHSIVAIYIEPISFIVILQSVPVCHISLYKVFLLLCSLYASAPVSCFHFFFFSCFVASFPWLLTLLIAVHQNDLIEYLNDILNTPENSLFFTHLCIYSFP